MSAAPEKESPVVGDLKEVSTAEPTSQDYEPEEEEGGMLDALIGDGYNQREVQFVMAAAVLVAVNNGFVNGVSLSGYLLEDGVVPEEDVFFINKPSAMVSGTAGYITNNADNLAEGDWPNYIFNLSMFLGYTGGALIVSLISPRAKPYAIDPGYWLCWIIGGSFLLTASMLSVYEYPTRGIWVLAIAANGVSNGIASIYSANLIRCTLTGAMTDIGLIIGQLIRRGKSDKLARGVVLGVIVIAFWSGGIIAFYAVRQFRSYTLIINAVLFYLVGVLNVIYLIYQNGLSIVQAITGNWDYTDILKKIQPSADKEEMFELFDILDDDGGGTLDMYELRKGLEGKVTKKELKILLIAADEDGDGEISKDEWEHLVENLFIVEE
jgi:uncharacterized membrane protein YoaK (UPF0700 family)